MLKVLILQLLYYNPLESPSSNTLVAEPEDSTPLIPKLIEVRFPPEAKGFFL
jgi:hypothetical protein